MNNKTFSTTDAPAEATAQLPGKKGMTRYTPDADSDFSTVVSSINAAWGANAHIKLLWIKQTEFELMVNHFNQSLQTRKMDGSLRPSQTNTLKKLNAQIDEGVQNVKTYVEYKFKKTNATAEFARYGIVKEKRGYALPKDNDERLKSLPLMVAAIAADGFGNEEFGTAFWTGITKDFTAAIKAARNTDGKVTGSVSAKDQSKKELIKVMNALRLSLQANYPDTYPAVYRQWGWQKEKY